MKTFAETFAEYQKIEDESERLLYLWEFGKTYKNLPNTDQDRLSKEFFTMGREVIARVDAILGEKKKNPA